MVKSSPSGQTCCLEPFGEESTVVLFPSIGCRGIRQEDPDASATSRNGRVVATVVVTLGVATVVVATVVVATFVAGGRVVTLGVVIVAVAARCDDQGERCQ